MGVRPRLPGPRVKASLAPLTKARFGQIKEIPLPSPVGTPRPSARSRPTLTSAVLAPCLLPFGGHLRYIARSTFCRDQQITPPKQATPGLLPDLDYAAQDLTRLCCFRRHGAA